jgi:hypothetical protein
MSKTSPKQRYIQLQEWLAVFKKTTDTNKRTGRRFSKADHYRAKGAR